MVVPSLIKRARLDAGLSQRDLAAQAGTSQPTLSAYERGTKSPSAETLVRILAAAGHRLTTERVSASGARDPWAANEASIADRLRAAGERSLGANLSDGLDMIETLSSFTGAATKGR